MTFDGYFHDSKNQFLIDENIEECVFEDFNFKDFSVWKSKILNV